MRIRGLIAAFAVLGVVAGVAAVGIVQSPDPTSAVGIVSIAGGGFHTCVLTSTGSAQCWGRNDFGQLGDGTTQDRTSAVEVAGLTDATALSAGGFHTCAVTSSGGVQCWGRNDFGQLGDGTTLNRTMPVDVGTIDGVLAVSAGGLHSCALTKAGALWCWGRNDRGQVGDGSTTDRPSPVEVVGLTDAVSAVAAGGGDSSGAHTCSVTSSGGVQCWGRNDFGQLGDGTMTDRVSPVDITEIGGVADIVAGRYHSCARTDVGGATCWGWNIGGQLGDGTNTTRTTPVDVSGLASGVADLSAGGMHNCALTASGGVKCWGFNTSGELGDGTSGNSRTMPVDVLEAPAGPPLANIAAIATGGGVAPAGHTCAITAVGSVWCWGDNSFGQLGDSTTTNRASPIGVIGFAAKPTPTETQTVTNTPTETTTPSETPTPMATSTETPVPLPVCPDVTGDGWVTVFDVLAIAFRIETQEGDALYNVRFDLNRDGRIDLQDLRTAADQFGARC